MGWAGHVTCMGDDKCIQGFAGKTIRKEALGRPRCRQKNNLPMDLTEMGWGDMDWIHMAQDRSQWQALVYMVMNLQVP
jgi:hypothetical protein